MPESSSDDYTHKFKDDGLLATNGIFALAMAGYLQWLAPRYEHIRSQLAESVSELRQLVHQTDVHKRTPTTIAQLANGLRIFLRFAVDVGALTQAEADHQFKTWWSALLEAGNRHAVHVSTADPVTRFLNLLTAALSSGHAHVAGSDGARPQDGVSARACGWRTVEAGSIVEWRPQGDRIGWIVGDDLYLEPESAFHAAQKMAAASGEAVSMGSRTLWKRLHERGVLASADELRDRLTVRRTLEGVRRQVLHFRMATLLPTADELAAPLDSDCGDDAGTIPSTVDDRP